LNTESGYYNDEESSIIDIKFDAEDDDEVEDKFMLGQRQIGLKNINMIDDDNKGNEILYICTLIY
jgi:hypothetical protein